MPHATIAHLGFQAFILCGPGASLNTFTSNPKEFPKALVPIANRPMLWYPLEWCYRMGITITPPESTPAIEAALSQNPHLTSLHSHRPDILAPEGLTQTTGTGELFRFPEVQAAVLGDFIILPCDLVCELDGLLILKEWMVHQAALGGDTVGISNSGSSGPEIRGGERLGRRGGLGIWYQTKGEGSVKGEETDFIATAAMAAPIVAPPPGSLNSDMAQLVYSYPTDTLKDITEANKGFPIRHSLLKRHGRIRMHTTYRDAHVYFFPYWVLEMMKRNEKFESVSEDVVGWWAKASWQEGLGDKLGLRSVLNSSDGPSSEDGMNASLIASGTALEDIDLGRLSSTWTSDPSESDMLAQTTPGGKYDTNSPKLATTASKLTVPPILAYVQPSDPSLPLIRRVDTAALLLSVSLRLAKLPSVDEVGRTAASPFAHAAKISHPESIPKRCSVYAGDSLIAENVTVEEKVNIKESVIGPNCTIGEGARLLRCLLMEGAVVERNCQLSGCILGRRSKIEGGPAKDDSRTNLKECEVQEGYVVPWGTDAKNEKFMAFDGLSDDAADMGEEIADKGDDPPEDE